MASRREFEEKPVRSDQCAAINHTSRDHDSTSVFSTELSVRTGGWPAGRSRCGGVRLTSQLIYTLLPDCQPASPSPPTGVMWDLKFARNFLWWLDTKYRTWYVRALEKYVIRKRVLVVKGNEIFRTSYPNMYHNITCSMFENRWGFNLKDKHKFDFRKTSHWQNRFNVWDENHNFWKQNTQNF